MSRIDRFGGPKAPQTTEELQEGRERGRAGKSSGEGTGGAKSATTDADGAPRVNAADAERLVSQAGFARAGKKRRPGELDVGDASQAPIPLPEDDVAPETWSAEALALVQTQLGGQAAALGRARTRGAGTKGRLRALFAALVEQSAGEEPSEADAARLAALGEGVPPDAAALGALARDTRAHFGLELTGLDVGAQLLAASMLVGGHASQVAVLPQAEASAPELDGERLADGVQRVLDGGRDAVDDGRRMNDGVSRQLSMHRTFVFKR